MRPFRRFNPQPLGHGTPYHGLKPAFLPGLVVFVVALFTTPGWSAPSASVTEQPDLSVSERILSPFSGDLPDLRERRIIRVLVSHTRTNFFLTERGFRGLEYDLLKAYEAFLNRGPRRQRYQTHLSFVPLPFGEILPSLQKGLGDIAASGLTVTPERRNLVDFADPYITEIQEVLVSHKDALPIDTLRDFSGKQVIVVGNSSYIIHLEQVNQTLGSMGLPPIEIIRANPLLEAEDLLEMVNEGLHDYTVTDSHIANIWQQVLPDVRVQRDLVLYHNANIAWAIQKNKPKLKASLNRFVQLHAKPGRFLRNSVYQKYFENAYWLRQPLTHDLLQKVDCLKTYFQYYGDFYGFDWRLLAALAYQESRFDQSKRSHAGAVGLMQIKPSTARDRHVQLPDVYDLETNVHAGVRYLAFLRDRYFSSRQYSDDDRMHFTLAAYNAGPRRVLELQRQAQSIGLSPNQWFYHVETIARNVIGHETVNYVTQILKMRLFLAHSETLEAEKRALKFQQQPPIEDLQPPEDLVTQTGDTP
ncbi:MAG: transporter substrate-binding domain-containing protein [Hydrogenovibrio sp.]|uniref:transglycosylase SLT domain-containing protein n=1 Tax=Hydrogenovibrio sp. TaxID=2065821 RepID=UPI00287066C8|nr:transporter substrate-binding domain-containing protein [Hydrogenovibrio sp.]MDR9499327.1 transporter substrate-binding domain-containing protein [Hydrogenovibrio sp.]